MNNSTRRRLFNLALAYTAVGVCTGIVWLIHHFLDLSMGESICVLLLSSVTLLAFVILNLVVFEIGE